MHNIIVGEKIEIMLFKIPKNFWPFVKSFKSSKEN